MLLDASDLFFNLFSGLERLSDQNYQNDERDKSQCRIADMLERFVRSLGYGVNDRTAVHIYLDIASFHAAGNATAVRPTARSVNTGQRST